MRWEAHLVSAMMNVIDSTIPRKKGASLRGFKIADLMPGEKENRKPQSMESMKMIAEMFAAGGWGTITVGQSKN